MDHPTKADSRRASVSDDSRPAELAATLPPAPMPLDGELAPGSLVEGRYRIIEKLGEGGMGAVFVAEHLKLRKQVALKTIHAQLAGHAEIAARFSREAMASARIEHPGVVSALDFGTLATGGAFLVMQFVRGEGLRKRLEREGVLPWRAACELIEQIADAVAAAHAVGIVHRDLKPENVVLEPTDRGASNVKVLDFGIAHLRSEARSPGASPGGTKAPLTQLGVVMGTPGYMAPEQAVGQAVDERADVYALGVMLWECLAGCQPFQGDSLTEIISKQFAPAPPGLPVEAPPVPAGLAALLARMLTAQPETRVASAVEVRDALRALRRDGVAAGGPASSAGGGSPTFARLAQVPRTYLAAGAALVLLLLLLLFSRSDQPESPPNALTPTDVNAPAQVRSPGKQTKPQADEHPKVAAPAVHDAESAAAASEPGVEREDEEESETTTTKGKTRRRSQKASKTTKRTSSSSPRVGTRIKRSLDALFK